MTEANITVDKDSIGALVVSVSLDDGTSIVLTVPEAADDQVVEQLVKAFPDAVEAGLGAYLAKAGLLESAERRA